MELSLATIYGLLVAVGLVSVDTVLNANTLYLNSSVAQKFEEAGYTSEVLEQHLINQLAIIADTKSLVTAPVVKSSDTPSFSAAIAALVNLQDSLEAAQQLVGLHPPKLYAAAVRHGETDVIELTGRSHLFGRFSIQVTGEEKEIDQMIEEAAYRTYREIDPYAAILYKFSQESADLPKIEEEIDGFLVRLKTTPFIKLRSELHNLKGIVALDRNEIDEAVVAFEDALHDDPSSVVARLNLAFALVQIDEYQHAIDATAFVTDPWLWPATSDPALLSTAYIIRGAARWGQQDLTAAMHDFEYAAYLQPTSTAANWYWSRLLRLRGDPDEADKKLEVARDNLSYFETYPELALLYFWVSEQDQRPLERRTNDFPSWSGSSDADPASSTAPGATPTAPTSSHSRT